MPSAVSPPTTLYDKVLLDHIVDEREDGTVLLYIGNVDSTCPIDSLLIQLRCPDRHLVHEVTSPVSQVLPNASICI